MFVCSFAGPDAGVCRPSCSLSGCTIGACQNGYCTEQQVRAVQSAAEPLTDAGLAVALPVEQVVVTAVKFAVPGADPTDGPGFFVQAGSAGLFVQAVPSPAPVAGDRVSFGVTSVSKELGQRRARTISNYLRLATSVTLPPAVDVATLDLTRATVRSDNESALTRVLSRAVANNDFDGGSSGYGEVRFSTLPATTTLRLAASLNQTEDLRDGCAVTATGPLWLGPGVGGKVSVWTSSALAGSSCPAPLLGPATSPTFSRVEVDSTRYMSPAAPANFVLRVRNATQTLGLGSVSLSGPQRYVLQAPMDPGWEYELNVSGTPPTDTRGRPANSPPLQFVAGGCQSTAPVVISAVYRGSSTFMSEGAIELHNRTSSSINLGAANYVLVRRTMLGGYDSHQLFGVIPAGGYFLVDDNFGPGDDNWSGMNLSSGTFIALGLGIPQTCNPPNAMDVVQFGNGGCGGASLPQLDPGDVYLRRDPAGCVKTASLTADFIGSGNPRPPRNLSTPPAICLCP